LYRSGVLAGARSLERSAGGQLRRHENVALVFDREKAGRHPGETIAGAADHDERDDAHEAAVRHHAADQPRIRPFERIIDRIEAAKEPVALFRRHRRPQP